jgi:hypothetical protein
MRRPADEPIPTGQIIEVVDEALNLVSWHSTEDGLEWAEDRRTSSDGLYAAMLSGILASAAERGSDPRRIIRSLILSTMAESDATGDLLRPYLKAVDEVAKEQGLSFAGMAPQD